MLKFKKLRIQAIDENNEVIRSTSFSRNKVDTIIQDDFWGELMDIFLDNDNGDISDLI